VNPASRISVVIASKYQHASMIAAKLFGRSLPEHGSLTIPRPLSAEAARGIALPVFEGEYRNAARKLSVTLAASGRLELHGPDPEGTLVPAGENMFLTDGARNNGALRFVQFLEKHDHAFRYLWDGRRLYRNERHPLSFAAVS
jgi:hypothetical protein